MPIDNEFSAEPGARDLAAALAQLNAIIDRNPALAEPLRAALEEKIGPKPRGGLLGGWFGSVRREDLDRAIDDRIYQLVRLVNDEGRLNYNPLLEALRDIAPMKLAIKALGDDLVRRTLAAPRAPAAAPRPVPLPWKPVTQADLESDWVGRWLAALKREPTLHRGPWQWAYILQVLDDFGMLAGGKRALGFGCGRELLPSFFAARGIGVVATDMPPEHPDKSLWKVSTDVLADLFHPALVARGDFDRHVNFEHVDMNAIPPHLAGFDFCWSVCSMEHVGSIAKAMDFVVDSLAPLEPGGVAVHTSEFNCHAEGPTADHNPVVLPQRRHFEALAARLREAGHETGALDFDLGDSAFDRFVDVPPYGYHMEEAFRAQWKRGNLHLKLSVHGFPSTAFGLWVKKRA
jgi:hypothetical protein